MVSAQYDKLGQQDEESAGKDKYWEELDDKERAAANLLGWDQKTWDEGDPGPMELKFWKASSLRLCTAPEAESKTLTEDERNAATDLGFTADTWDHGMDQHEAAIKIQHIFRTRAKPKPDPPPPSRPCRFKCCFGSAGPDAVAIAENEENSGAIALGEEQDV